ncbi:MULTISPECIES: PaaI family thioesterase [Mycobacteriales]|jgi:acyl-CoA thioesterase|uniref:PaaI family thioesterase n=2 Tax=Gordonia rubripertincta TaxID=36822 RepID=A0ABT4MV89_GORRU|nr:MULTISPECIES: PaaI family thioesterase [Mycobacteriales]MCZ4550719.1 PaaI family thioesterase [Gordonia rubripertincta]
MTGLEVLRYMTGLPERPPNIAQLVGMEVESLEEGHVRFSLNARPDMTNPIGSLHGGICATLLDSVMGCAVHTTLGPGVGYGTLELKVNYIRSVPTDGRRIIGRGKTIHVGRRTATAEGEIRDERDKLIAHGTTTCIIHQPA